MSNSDRRQIVYFSLIHNIAEEGYIPSRDRDNVMAIAIEGMKNIGILSPSEYKSIEKFYKELDKAVSYNFKSNSVDVLSYGIISAIADMYLTVLKDKKKLSYWQKLSDIAENYLSKKIIYTELDKSLEFLELVNKFIKNI